MKPYARKQLLERARRCRGGSAPTCSRSCAGSRITGGVFLRNMWRWMTCRKGALTTYYPEETRADYAPNNRGKHVLTQRPDGRPQCIACNMCATVCPAKVIEIEAGFDPDDPAHPEVPGALRDRLLALHLLRAVRRGLPGGRDPHGQGSARTCPRSTAGTCGWRSDELLTWNPQRDVAKPYPAKRSGDSDAGTGMIETLLLCLFAGTALVCARRRCWCCATRCASRWRSSRRCSRWPASTRCSACTSSRSSRC